MISLAAWITVSMSALSKLRTTKRPRCAGGTGGAVGGGGGGGAGAASGGCAAAGGIVRGPTETGGTAGSASADLGGATVTEGGGVAAGGGRRCEAHPAVMASTNSVATRRFILLRLARRNWWHPAAEARRGPPKGN